MRLITCCLFFLVLVPINGQSSRYPVDKPLENFTVSDERAIDIFRALAKQSHVVIGVSGELIGSDRTLISVEAKQATVRTVLDDICLKDPRYKWEEAKDGNINVSIGNKRLEFDDLNIATLKIGIINSPDLVMLISNQPDVKAWKARTNCDIMQVFAGHVGNIWHLDINANDEPLWKLLNEICAQNDTYFWSALKISTTPCIISFNP